MKQYFKLGNSCEEVVVASPMVEEAAKAAQTHDCISIEELGLEWAGSLSSTLSSNSRHMVASPLSLLSRNGSRVGAFTKATFNQSPIGSPIKQAKASTNNGNPAEAMKSLTNDEARATTVVG